MTKYIVLPDVHSYGFDHRHLWPNVHRGRLGSPVHDQAHPYSNFLWNRPAIIRVRDSYSSSQPYWFIPEPLPPHLDEDLWYGYNQINPWYEIVGEIPELPKLSEQRTADPEDKVKPLKVRYVPRLDDARELYHHYYHEGSYSLRRMMAEQGKYLADFTDKVSSLVDSLSVHPVNSTKVMAARREMEERKTELLTATVGYSDWLSDSIAFDEAVDADLVRQNNEMLGANKVHDLDVYNAVRRAEAQVGHPYLHPHPAHHITARTDARLVSMEVSINGTPLTLAPEFDPDWTAYTAEWTGVGAGVIAITRERPNTDVRATYSPNIIEAGAQSVTVAMTVTAADMTTTNVYNVTINRTAV